MSLSFCLCRGLGVYKGEHTQAGGWLSGSFGSCTSTLPLEKPPTLCCSYFSASWGVRVQLTGNCSSFVWLHVPKIILGTLSRYQFSCLQVNWVSLPLYIPWTLYQSGTDHNFFDWIGAHGINCYLGEPTNPSSIPISWWHYILVSWRILGHM